MFPTYPIVLPFKHTEQEVVDFHGAKSQQVIPGVPQFDNRRVVDGQRKMIFHKQLPVTSEGRNFELRSKVIGVYDKGKAGSVVEIQQEIVDKETGEVYSTAVGSGFYVGQGNWGGPKGGKALPSLDQGPATVNYPPPKGRNPDVVCEYQTTALTPLLYRYGHTFAWVYFQQGSLSINHLSSLNGDYNPLHADPEPGKKMGFGGVIIHGLFSWNMAAHAILQNLGGSNPQNLKEFQARFASPVRPGDKLTTEMWKTDKMENGFEEVIFMTKNQDGKVVLSNGRALVKLAGFKSKL
ncbi:hypothetical protein PRK78_000457 [Emydomyces testavorans]|uniref:MaoC-like domain-containing protein n=1 Tax=Emydomyces testavorans TaxID=2070801 RepID=A0AAF0DAS1_9EURO|nr:hypothetical protein PRK78_000457 [Emydomyces testavorans]